MLVLSRKQHESVVVSGSDGINRLLKVTIIEIDHAGVKLGFEVDPGIAVQRTENWENIIAAARNTC